MQCDIPRHWLHTHRCKYRPWHNTASSSQPVTRRFFNAARKTPSACLASAQHPAGNTTSTGRHRANGARLAESRYCSPFEGAIAANSHRAMDRDRGVEMACRATLYVYHRLHFSASLFFCFAISCAASTVFFRGLAICPSWFLRAGIGNIRRDTMQ